MNNHSCDANIFTGFDLYRYQQSIDAIAESKVGAKSAPPCPAYETGRIVFCSVTGFKTIVL